MSDIRVACNPELSFLQAFTPLVKAMQALGCRTAPRFLALFLGEIFAVCQASALLHMRSSRTLLPRVGASMRGSVFKRRIPICVVCLDPHVRLGHGFDKRSSTSHRPEHGIRSCSGYRSTVGLRLLFCYPLTFWLLDTSILFLY